VILKKDEGAVLCDFAEVYHIYNLRDFDAGYISALAAGLDENSRTVRMMSDVSASLDEILTAMIVDRLSYILYALAAKKGTKKPDSMVEALIKKSKQDERKYKIFSSPEEFEKACAAGGK